MKSRGAEVVFLQSAEADLRELKRYVAGAFGQQAWQACLGQIKAAVARIATHPGAGLIPDELASLELQQYRQVLCGMNRIIYEIRGGIVYIHIVCDTRKDFKALLTRRILRGD